MTISEVSNENDEEKNLLLVTIITVTYNSGSVLRQAFNSIINQTYKNIEFIVIDGGSTDETLDIIKEFNNYIDYCVSERDKGIYNAMNKGIEKTTGELVYFLNSDDYFCDNKVVEDIVHIYLQDRTLDVIYGDVVPFSTARGIIRRGGGRQTVLKDAQRGRVICHQALFMKRDLLVQHKFDERYKFVADFELQIKCFKQHRRFMYIKRAIAYYCLDGITAQAQTRRALLLEKIDVLKKHFGLVVCWRYYISAQLKLLRMSVQFAFRNLFRRS